VSVLAIVVYVKIDTLMLARMKTADEVARYAVAVKVVDGLAFLPTAAAALVLVAVAYALYESRARLVATDGGIAWRDFEVVNLPSGRPTLSFHGKAAEVEFISNSYQENHRSVAQCNIRDISERSRMEIKLKQQTESLSATLLQMETDCGKRGAA